MTYLNGKEHQARVIRIDLSSLDFVHRRQDYVQVLNLLTDQIA